MPPTKPGPMSDKHLALLRSAVVPGRREIDVTAAELLSLLDEVEHHRTELLDIPAPDEVARTRTLPTEDAAKAMWHATLTALQSDELEPDWLCTMCFFLGIGLPADRAKHLALQVWK